MITMSVITVSGIHERCQSYIYVFVDFPWLID